MGRETKMECKEAMQSPRQTWGVVWISMFDKGMERDLDELKNFGDVLIQSALGD